jgi:hypothetical protein
VQRQLLVLARRGRAHHTPRTPSVVLLQKIPAYYVH